MPIRPSSYSRPSAMHSPIVHQAGGADSAVPAVADRALPADRLSN